MVPSHSGTRPAKKPKHRRQQPGSLSRSPCCAPGEVYRHPAGIDLRRSWNWTVARVARGSGIGRWQFSYYKGFRFLIESMPQWDGD
jgi:hypothetical protein